MKTLIIAALIFLDVIPKGVPFVSDWKKGLEGKVMVATTSNVASEKSNARNEALDFSPLPYKGGNFYLPGVNAKAYEAVDMGTGEVMLEKNKDESLEIASLTKLMTARLALKDADLDKVVTANELSRVRSDDSKANINLNDQFTYRELLRVMLIDSASDAALTIANNLYGGGYNEFVRKMNEEAASLNMGNTHYDNPVGWDSSKNYSTTQDLQILTRTLLKNDEFKKIVRTSEENLTSEKGYIYPLKNTNVLLDGKTVFGVKTGRTPSAGDCLIAYTKVKNRDVLFVILGAGDRFAETKNLLNWSSAVYNW